MFVGEKIIPLGQVADWADEDAAFHTGALDFFANRGGCVGGNVDAFK